MLQLKIYFNLIQWLCVFSISLLNLSAVAGSLNFTQIGNSSLGDKGNLYGFSLTLNASTVTATADKPATPKTSDSVFIESISLRSGGGGQPNSISFPPVHLVLFDKPSGGVEIARSVNMIRPDGSQARGTAYDFQFGNQIQIDRNTTYYGFFITETGTLSRARVELNSSLGGNSTSQLLNNFGAVILPTYSPRFTLKSYAAPFNVVAQNVTSPQAPDYYYVIALAGQSNMVGYGEVLADPAGLDAIHPRVMQVGRAGNKNKTIIPADHSLAHVQDMRGSNFARSGNQVMVKNGTYSWSEYGGTVGAGQWIGKNLLPYLPPNAGILLVPAARGGASFRGGIDNAYQVGTTTAYVDGSGGGLSNGTWSRWGVSDGNVNNENRKTGLYLDMRERIKWALDQNPKNLFVGVVWMQGESDLTNPSLHKSKFEAQVQTLGVDLNTSHSSQCLNANCERTPWVTGDTSVAWNILAYPSVYLTTYAQSTLPNVSFVPFMYQTDGTETNTNFQNQYSYSNLTGADGRTSSSRKSHFSSDAQRGVIASKLAIGIRESTLKAVKSGF